MNIIVLIGRIMFVFVFLTAGFAHLTGARTMAPYAKSRGVPVPTLAVLSSGLLLLAGGLMVLLGAWADLGCLLLLAFLLPAALTMHGFWKESDPQAKRMEMTQFSKDIALAGASLMLFAFFSYTGHNLGLTLTGPLLHLH
jgi:putative oxidoreductase